jgi:Tfp pilus assembly protein PilE
LIEVLVVVAIIALLISILLPSLIEARRQAQIAKCLAHLSNLGKATYSFATSHNGYGQAVGEQVEWEHLDPEGRRYAYQMAPASAGSVRWLKAWQVAYARELTLSSVRRNEDLFDTKFNLPSDLAPQASTEYYYRKFGRKEVFECPSDKNLVKNAFYPCGPSVPCALYGAFSYSANEDVFGLTGVVPNTSSGDPAAGNALNIWPGEKDRRGHAWKDGLPSNGPWLAGRLEKIIRPSEVVLYTDGGKEGFPRTQCFLLSDGAKGPLLEDLSRHDPRRLPLLRHGNKGGLATSIADGSGLYAKPLRMDQVTDPVSGDPIPCVQKFAGMFRVSPYNR